MAFYLLALAESHSTALVKLEPWSGERSINIERRNFLWAIQDQHSPLFTASEMQLQIFVDAALAAHPMHFMTEVMGDGGSRLVTDKTR